MTLKIGLIKKKQKKLPFSVLAELAQPLLQAHLTPSFLAVQVHPQYQAKAQLEPKPTLLSLCMTARPRMSALPPTSRRN